MVGCVCLRRMGVPPIQSREGTVHLPRILPGEQMGLVFPGHQGNLLFLLIHPRNYTSASQNFCPPVSGAMGGGALGLNLATKVVLTENL